MNREVPVGYSAREIALERIHAQALRFPDLDIAPFDPRTSVGHADIDPRDVALARAIEHAVVRRYLTLIACVKPHLQKNWPMLEKPIQAALLGGAAQILFLDRVPAAAAVDASNTALELHADNRSQITFYGFQFFSCSIFFT